MKNFIPNLLYLAVASALALLNETGIAGINFKLQQHTNVLAFRMTARPKRSSQTGLGQPVLSFEQTIKGTATIKPE